MRCSLWRHLRYDGLGGLLPRAQQGVGHRPIELGKTSTPPRARLASHHPLNLYRLGLGNRILGNFLASLAIALPIAATAPRLLPPCHETAAKNIFLHNQSSRNFSSPNNPKGFPCAPAQHWCASATTSTNSALYGATAVVSFSSRADFIRIKGTDFRTTDFVSRKRISAQKKFYSQSPEHLEKNTSNQTRVTAGSSNSCHLLGGNPNREGCTSWRHTSFTLARSLLYLY